MSADAATNDDGGLTTPTTVVRRRSAKRKWLFSTILVPVAFAVLGLSVLGFGLILQNRTPDKPEPKPKPEPTIGKSISEEEKRSGYSASFAEVELALQRAQFQIELATAKQLQRELRFAKTELDNLLKSTESDSVGKRIAGNEELLLRFRAFKRSVKDRSPLSATSLSKFEDAAQNATGNHKQLYASLNEETKRLAQAILFNDQHLSYLNKMRESAASLPPSEQTLAATISHYESSLGSLAETAANSAANDLDESLKSEYSDAIADRDNSAELVAGLESQLKRIMSGKPLTPDTDGAVVPQAIRDDYNRELEKMRTHLVAFTTPGYVQPESADNLVYRNVKQPMSYSVLQQIGALNPTDEGRAILLRVGGSKSATQRNDRPLGSFPRMNSIEQLRNDKNLKARVNEAQQFLRRYGPLMVEDGLLLP